MTKVSTLADMQRSREIVAEGPSGLVYKIRPLNLERHALAGSLPGQLRQIALKGASGVDEVLGSDEAELLTRGAEMRDALDDMVRSVVVEPELPGEDLDILPPVDYRWLVRIALGEEDRDGRERRLWGREPLTLWSTFRDEHGCDTDCEACDRMSRPVAEVHRGRVD